MDLPEHKRALRRDLSARRRRLSAEDADAAGRRVARWVSQAPEYLRAERIALYAALADELPTLPLFESIRGAGRIALFPRCTAEGLLEFASVSRWEELRSGRYGVLEPAPEAPAARMRRDDLVIVPGVAFDAAGHRLGRGAGSYDRAFPVESESVPTLFGLAFAFQVVARVPTGPHDRRVDAIVTEDGLLRAEFGACGGGAR